MAKLICPNCGEPVCRPSTGEVHEAGCVLHALIGVVRDRETVPERKLRTIHANVDTDALWNDVGRIIDRLEEGRYS